MAYFTGYFSSYFDTGAESGGSPVSGRRYVFRPYPIRQRIYWSQPETAPVPVERYTETPAGRRRKRYYVEIDGQEFQVANPTEALALLDRAKALAQRVAPQTAEQVVAKAIRKAQAPAVKTPEIKASPELAEVVAKPRQDIERIYRDAALAAEIRLLMELRAEQDDEEALLLLI